MCSLWRISNEPNPIINGYNRLSSPLFFKNHCFWGWPRIISFPMFVAHKRWFLFTKASLMRHLQAIPKRFSWDWRGGGLFGVERIMKTKYRNTKEEIHYPSCAFSGLSLYSAESFRHRCDPRIGKLCYGLPAGRPCPSATAEPHSAGCRCSPGRLDTHME